MKKKCIGCEEYKNCKDSINSWLFFIVGLVATIAIRVVTVLIHLNPLYAKIAWYLGVGGFTIFFVYKFRVSQARLKLINQNHLMEKINQRKQFTKEDYSLLGAILCGINSTKERMNYLFIFALSAIALVLALYMDFFR